MSKLVEKIKQNKEEQNKKNCLKEILENVKLYEENIKNYINTYPEIVSIIISDESKNKDSVKHIDRIAKRITDYSKSPYVLLEKQFSPYAVFKFTNEAIIKIQKLENKINIIFNEESTNYDYLMVFNKGYKESISKARELGEKIEELKFQKVISQIEDLHNKVVEKQDNLTPQIAETKALISETNVSAKNKVVLAVTEKMQK